MNVCWSTLNELLFFYTIKICNADVKKPQIIVMFTRGNKSGSHIPKNREK